MCGRCLAYSPRNAGDPRGRLGQAHVRGLAPLPVERGSKPLRRVSEVQREGHGGDGNETTGDATEAASPAPDFSGVTMAVARPQTP
jgi:hypothetical protein